jgi:multiple sugar transport system permease protein
MSAALDPTVAGSDHGRRPPSDATDGATKSRRRRPWAWFLLPFLVPFVLFYVVPIGYAIYQSLFKIQRTGGIFGKSEQVFAGLSQYADVFTDETFRQGVLRVLLFGIVQVPIMLGLALVSALLLDSAVAYLKRFFRIAFFVPYGIPGVIAALMWAFLYSPQLSPIVAALDRVGTAPDFLGSSLILWSIANVTTWTYTGYNMLIIFAALQALPQEIFEASRIDGAGGIRTAFSIKIPLVFPALVLTTVFSIIGTLQLFTEPVVFQTISTNVTSGYTPNMQAYAVAASNNYSFSAALSVVLAVATFVLSFGFLRFTQRRGEAL